MKQKDNKNSSTSCMSLCVMLIIIIHIIALMGMMSCSTHRHAVTVEREMHTDTVYVTRQQYDSIFIWKDRWTDRTHDTVYIRELSTEYRYKLLRGHIAHSGEGQHTLRSDNNGNEGRWKGLSRGSTGW